MDRWRRPVRHCLECVEEARQAVAKVRPNGRALCPSYVKKQRVSPQVAWTAALIVAVGFLAMIAPAFAHEDGRPNWITNGGYQGTDNIHCCGPSDCFAIDFSDVQVTLQGYVLKTYGNELVPFAEATPSEDKRIWRCRRGDGVRRCFFAPVGGS